MVRSSPQKIKVIPTAQSDTESEQINVAGAEEVNGDGSKPCPCVTCGKTFKAETIMKA